MWAYTIAIDAFSLIKVDKDECSASKMPSHYASPLGQSILEPTKY